MVSFQGYFDESGDFDEDSGIFCVSGYFFTEEAALEIEEKWREVLAEHNIPYFHMVECAHGTGVFAFKEKKENVEIQTKLINLIKNYALEGFSVISKEEEFEPSEENPNPYSSCAEMCIEALKAFLKINRIDGDIAYYFESGHKDKKSASGIMAERLREDIDSLHFKEKTQAPLLQAADLLAWQTTKYVKDRISGERPPRKDFESLMERDHSFYYISIKEAKSMLIELWPVEKRTQYGTRSMSINKDGPFPCMILEGEEDIPVVFVNESNGWRPAWGEMVFVSFKTLDDKRFALGFNEGRLWESVLSLLAATEAYANRDLCPVLPAKDIILDKSGSDTVLRIKMFNGANIAFHISDEMFGKLKKIINEDSQ